jgi:hypothetical protein
LKLIFIPVLSMSLFGFGYATGSCISSFPFCVFVAVGVSVFTGIVVAVLVTVKVRVLAGVNVLVEVN